MGTDKIVELYTKYILENGEKPSSVYAFAKEINLSEAEFYGYFSSFELIEQEIWVSFFNSTLLRLKADENYSNYGAREKLLAFYYTWLEELLKNRSYILLVFKNLGSFIHSSHHLSSFKELFLKYAQEIVNEGKESKEIVDDFFFSSKYADGIWVQLIFVLNFWIKDTSFKFEKTDAAIEKAINLSFEFMASNFINSAIDFGKFLLNRK